MRPHIFACASLEDVSSSFRNCRRDTTEQSIVEVENLHMLDILAPRAEILLRNFKNFGRNETAEERDPRARRRAPAARQREEPH